MRDYTQDFTRVSASAKTKIANRQHGQNWFDSGVIASLVDVIRLRNQIKDDLTKDLSPYKTIMDDIKTDYAIFLTGLDELETAIRTRIMNEDSNRTTIAVPQGTVSFVKKTAVTVEDESKVPKKYLKTIVDLDKINEDINAGVRNIKGIAVTDDYTLRVTPAKTND